MLYYKVMGRGGGDGRKRGFRFRVPSYISPRQRVMLGSFAVFSDPESSSSCVRLITRSIFYTIRVSSERQGGHEESKENTEMVKQPTRTLYVYLMARVISGSLLTRPSRPLSHLISFLNTTRANEREVGISDVSVNHIFFPCVFLFIFLDDEICHPRCAWPFQFIFQLVPFFKKR